MYRARRTCHGHICLHAALDSGTGSAAPEPGKNQGKARTGRMSPLPPVSIAGDRGAKDRFAEGRIRGTSACTKEGRFADLLTARQEMVGEVFGVCKKILAERDNAKFWELPAELDEMLHSMEKK